MAGNYNSDFRGIVFPSERWAVPTVLERCGVCEDATVEGKNVGGAREKITPAINVEPANRKIVPNIGDSGTEGTRQGNDFFVFELNENKPLESAGHSKK
jgi:hypothetical protein